jgi:RNA polymerase sigma-70 factor (ECF subfamily)
MGARSDTEAFEQLYRSTYPKITTYCRRRLAPNLVEDAVGDIYAVAWTKADQALSADEPLAWLYGVAFRVVSTQYRATVKQRGLLDRLNPASPVAFPPADLQADADADVRAAFLALAELKPFDQELIRLAAFEDLSIAQISVVVGRSEASVRSSLHRARRRLRALYRDKGDRR